ncbi:multiple sugar transport system permease protein [Streptomyces sp. SAI-208]|jgi:multiple sugar transport system permease protein|uniref:carbohydrate ABC transporter permease n=1 Tax=unclassified Streptomyces TaxID=2593676 RepID=UPI002473BA4E|nr:MULTISPECIES: carbohydrate ABC transporter permease [unclassified Streptomyces]MDH6514120.1 multiple sugar transport system permease protein [Streptomyces sp. SAI-090]MDH6546298.1 multiple sugar transport system permease protein [Streptomyces sp. SAI-041]MDH6565394.1 multiple sugar transport system permease protein [Streptomyces sp. SAI-117]MDH6589689.1 multiple sugar transport system permease protein [Streptomyces sp. SAI-133]MDH6604958.1 multiple sugar transport system permease protein [S
MSAINERTHERTKIVPTLIMVAGALYCLLPVAWVFVAASKAPGELFDSFTFAPGTGLLDNLRDLFSYDSGAYGLWALNSLLYAGVGGVLSTFVSASAGYALAKFDFRGGRVFFAAILAGLLIPGITLAVPQYLLLSDLHLAGTQWSVLLPSILSPFGIYLCRVYAASAIPAQMLEAARIDGAGEWRIFRSVVLPLMGPGMVTVFLLQFVGIWNNFLLPYIMLSNTRTFPLTVGLNSLLERGSGSPSLYTLAVIGAALAIIPLIALVLFLQRFWRLDLIAGGVKG